MILCARTVFIVLTAGFGTSGIAMHSNDQSAKTQELIQKVGPIDSGIYNLRRQSIAPAARHLRQRKPRVKPDSETVAALD